MALVRNYGEEFREFADLLFLGYVRGCVAMIGAYVDESGSPDFNQTTLVLSAFYTTTKDWQKLVREWMGIVGRSKVTCFHATDCANGAKEFDGWSNERKKNLFRTLLNVLKNHSNLKGYSAGVALKDYADVVIPTPKADELFGGPRGLAFQLLLQGIAKRAEMPIAVIMDKPPKGWGKLDEIFDKTKQEKMLWAGNLHSLTPGDARTFPGIQVADLLAYETYRHLNMTLKAEPHRKERKSLVRLILEKAPMGKYFDKQSLIALIEQCKKDGKL
jgi:hypothetical protein